MANLQFGGIFDVIKIIFLHAISWHKIVTDTLPRQLRCEFLAKLFKNNYKLSLANRLKSWQDITKILSANFYNHIFITL